MNSWNRVAGKIMIAVGERHPDTVTYAVSESETRFRFEIDLILSRGFRFTNRIVRVGRYSN